MERIDGFIAAYGHALEEAARLGAEETKLEEERKILFSKLVVDAGDISAVKAEHVARASASYREHGELLATVRLQCALAKAKAQHMTARLDIWRTRESTRRAQQRRDQRGTQEADDDER